MAEFQRCVWAPWRMEYIEELSTHADQGCFLCRYHQTPADDRQNRVLWRSEKTLVALNRFPYSSGHVLIAPAAHQAQPEDLPEDVLAELMLRLRDVKRILARALDAQGFNIGMNLGRCAGAGLPDHLHWHVVPRWEGDTNFMPVLADVKVVPETLDRICAKFAAARAQLGL